MGFHGLIVPILPALTGAATGLMDGKRKTSFARIANVAPDETNLTRQPITVQTGVLPWRVESGVASILLITSRSTGRWIIPKGGQMTGKTLWEAAKQEACEEAGVLGEVQRVSIGAFHHKKVHPTLGPLDCRIEVYPMQVTEVLLDWPERSERTRTWFDLDLALAAVESVELKTIIERFFAGRADCDPAGRRQTDPRTEHGQSRAQE